MNTAGIMNIVIVSLALSPEQAEEQYSSLVLGSGVAYTVHRGSDIVMLERFCTSP